MIPKHATYRRTGRVLTVCCLLVFPLFSGCGQEPESPISEVMAVKVSEDESADISLAQVYEVLQRKRFVDLTHAFEPGIPHWTGFPDETFKTIYWYDQRPDILGTGFFAQVYCHVGQWGTHADPPVHFIKGDRTLW